MIVAPRQIRFQKKVKTQFGSLGTIQMAFTDVSMCGAIIVQFDNLSLGQAKVSIKKTSLKHTYIGELDYGTFSFRIVNSHKHF